MKRSCFYEIQTDITKKEIAYLEGIKDSLEYADKLTRKYIESMENIGFSEEEINELLNNKDYLDGLIEKYWFIF